MSAERGRIVEPPPLPTEWHTPGWIKEGGRHFITPPDARVPASSTVRLEGGQVSEPPERSPNGPVRCQLGSSVASGT